MLPGFSGSPLLDLRAGAVAGIVESTRGEHANLGGFAVPVQALAAAFPDVVEANREFQRVDNRWKVALEAERARAAERVGMRARFQVVGRPVRLAARPVFLFRP